jgi:hypothetical protein
LYGTTYIDLIFHPFWWGFLAHLPELLPSLGIHRLLTFHILIISSETPRLMNWNLVGSIYGRSSIKIAHFVPIH